MNKIQKHIEIVHSTRGDLISLGQSSLASVYEVLSQHYEHVGVSVVNDIADLLRVVSLKPDLVFLGMKQLPIAPMNTPIWISDYLDAEGIAYTGSPQAAIELESNKLLGKQRVLDAGLDTAACVSVDAKDSTEASVIHLRFPLFVKPTDLGGGMGIDEQSVVTDMQELRAKIQSLQSQYNSQIMIEEYLPGREFSVALLVDEFSGELLAMPIEITPVRSAGKYSILDHATKAKDTEKVTLVAELLRQQLADYAKAAFTALGGRDYGRIDIRLDADGAPNFLEANLIPGLGAVGGYFPKAARLNMSLSYSEVILRIASLGLVRQVTDLDEAEYEPEHLLSPNAATA